MHKRRSNMPARSLNDWRDENPTEPNFQNDLAKSHANISFLQMQRAGPPKALQSIEQARAIFERLALAHPSVTEFKNRLAESHKSIGFLQSQAGRPAEALRSYEQQRRSVSGW